MYIFQSNEISETDFFSKMSSDVSESFVLETPFNAGFSIHGHYVYNNLSTHSDLLVWEAFGEYDNHKVILLHHRIISILINELAIIE